MSWNEWEVAMRLYLLCLVSLLPGFMGRGADPARMPPPNVSADLLAPCAGYTGPVPTTEGQLSNALIAEAQGRGCANGKLEAVGEILT
jgi:hypothetical protein